MPTTIATRSFVTGDGVRLRYREAGNGRTIVLLPGWSQTAELFSAQSAGLGERFRVIALDQRGHGESEKPDHGYRIARLAKDLFEVFSARDLRSVVLLGHGMGCAVIWSYLDLFGADRLARLVFADGMPAMLADPAWTAGARAEAGSVYDCDSLSATCARLVGEKGVDTTRTLVDAMLTPGCDERLRALLLAEQLRMPREHAATLLRDAARADWRDAIARIALPTLVIGGRASFVPSQSQEWMHARIAGSRLETIASEDGGGHVPFLENPTLFNRLVGEFAAVRT